MNLSLTPWHWGFFERLAKSVKDLLIKDLKGSRSSYEEMQTVLFECQAILNNRPLTCIYPTDLTSCLTPNHLLYGCVITVSSSIQSSPLTNHPSELTAYSNQVTTEVNLFWNKWRCEYLANLRERHKHYYTKKHQPFMQVNDVVLVYSDKTPRSMWRMGVVTELIKGKMDNNIRKTLVRLSNNSLLKRPVNKLCPTEYVRSNRQDPADTGNLTRSRPEAAEIGEL